MFSRLHKLNLAPKERDVIRLASDGLTDKQIASRLDVAGATLKTYWARIRTKLNAVNRVHAVANALAVMFKEAQDEVKRRGAASERLIESNILGFLVLNVDGKVTEVNEEVLRMLGRERRDVEGRRLMAITCPDYREMVRAALAAVQTGPENTPAMELELMHETGDAVPAIMRLACFAEDGTCVAYIVDLSEEPVRLMA